MSKFKTLAFKHFAKLTLLQPLNLQSYSTTLIEDMHEDGVADQHHIDQITKFYDRYKGLYELIKSTSDIEEVRTYVEETQPLIEDIFSFVDLVFIDGTWRIIREHVRQFNSKFLTSYESFDAIIRSQNRSTYVQLDGVEYASHQIQIREDEWMIVYTPSHINFHMTGTKAEVVERMHNIIAEGGVCGVTEVVENEWSGRESFTNFREVKPKLRVEEYYDYE